MPVIFKTDTAGGTLALWHATESEERLRALASVADAASCEGFSCPRRRIERLAWRALLRELLPDVGDVVYDTVGAPRVEGFDGNIGVSHTCGHGGIYAAVIMSKYPCAVDMESLSRDFSRVAPRYLSAGERALPAAREPWFAAAAWCAKETIYKLTDARGADFTKDIRVTAADAAQGTIEAAFSGRRLPDIRFTIHDGICMVWAEKC